MSWSPHISIKNGHNLTTLFDTGNRRHGERKVRRTIRQRGDLYEEFNLRQFPFDSQELHLIVRSGLPTDQVQLMQVCYCCSWSRLMVGRQSEPRAQERDGALLAGRVDCAVSLPRVFSLLHSLLACVAVPSSHARKSPPTRHSARAATATPSCTSRFATVSVACYLLSADRLCSQAYVQREYAFYLLNMCVSACVCDRACVLTLLHSGLYVFCIISCCTLSLRYY